MAVRDYCTLLASAAAVIVKERRQKAMPHHIISRLKPYKLIDEEQTGGLLRATARPSRSSIFCYYAAREPLIGVITIHHHHQGGSRRPHLPPQSFTRRAARQHHHSSTSFKRIAFQIGNVSHSYHISSSSAAIDQLYRPTSTLLAYLLRQQSYRCLLYAPYHYSHVGFGQPPSSKYLITSGFPPAKPEQ